MLRRNGPVVKSVESVMRLEGSLWWKRFVKEVGLEAGVKERSYGWWEWWVDRGDMVGAWTDRTETEGLRWGWRRELGSWFQRPGKVYRKERSVIRSEDDVGGRARVTRDEEWVLRGGWTEMRWWRYGDWVVVRTLWVKGVWFDAFSYFEPVKRA